MPPERDNKEICSKLDTLNSKMDTLLTWKVKHITSHELIERDVADNRAALFENPGVISKVQTLWNCKKQITRWREFWMTVLQYLIIAGIVGVIGWVLLHYKGS